MKKRLGLFSLAILLALTLFSGFVSAQNYNIDSHTINIQVDTEGNGSVVERFYLTFPDETEKALFRQQSTEFGTDIEKWKAFNKVFSPNIGSDNQINGKISYNEADRIYLELKYGLSDPIMEKGKDTTLLVEYSIKANYFNNFFQSGLWIIPDNTELTIELPPGAEINDAVEPEAVIATNVLGKGPTVTWEGYKSANKLTLNYKWWKKIEAVVDLGSIIQFLFRTTEGLLLIAAFIIAVGIILWKRKKITAKVEEFVEENSVIEEE